MARNASERLQLVTGVAALLLVTLIFGLAFAHVMELPGKVRLDGLAWLVVQQNLYIGFGPLAAVVEPLSILLTGAFAFTRRRSRIGFRLALLAGACTALGLIEWAFVVAPMNTLLNGWTPATLPVTWTACRDQWELGHAIHAALFGAALCLLLGALLTKQESR